MKEWKGELRGMREGQRLEGKGISTAAWTLGGPMTASCLASFQGDASIWSDLLRHPVSLSRNVLRKSLTFRVWIQKLASPGPFGAEVFHARVSDLVKVNPKSGQRCGHVGSKRSIWIEAVHLNDFGPICKRRKLPQSRALFGRPALSKMPCTPCKMYQSDRSVRIPAYIRRRRKDVSI